MNKKFTIIFIMLFIFSLVFIMFLTFSLSFLDAKLETIYNKTAGTEVSISRTDRERNAFKHSKAYIENSIQTLHNYKMQYDLANNEDKTIIANNIRSEFANFNANNIDNTNLRIFLLRIQEEE